MHHYRGTFKAYKARNQGDTTAGVGCSLCETITDSQVVQETPTMRVVKNRIPYDVFDGLRTTGRHYMIVPKRHVSLISEFTDAEKLEMMQLIGAYEKEGFSVYARSKTNIHRSQPHQHTHLIELSKKEPRLVLYSAKPYVLLTTKGNTLHKT
jgi:diadenosine tetraphosphate (Ap4A) HIT family hydrolase